MTSTAAPGTGALQDGGNEQDGALLSSRVSCSRRVVQQAHGAGTGNTFLPCAPLMLLAVVAISLIHEVPLRSQSGDQLADQPERPAPAPARMPAAQVTGAR